jgi:ferritin-like metal-binding protein YciE
VHLSLIRLRWLTLLLVVAAPLILAACGGDDDDNSSDNGTPANSGNLSRNEKWVAGVCTSFSGWVDDITTAETKLQASLDNATSAQDLKQKLVDFLKTGQTETKNLQKELNALRAPDVKDGDKIHKVFTDAAAQFVAVFNKTVSDAQKIDASSLSKVTDDLESFETTISDSFGNLSSAFDGLDKYQNTELEDLFQSRPECSALGE